MDQEGISFTSAIRPLPVCLRFVTIFLTRLTVLLHYTWVFIKNLQKKITTDCRRLLHNSQLLSHLVFTIVGCKNCVLSLFKIIFLITSKSSVHTGSYVLFWLPVDTSISTHWLRYCCYCCCYCGCFVNVVRKVIVMLASIYLSTILLSTVSTVSFARFLLINFLPINVFLWP